MKHALLLLFLGMLSTVSTSQTIIDWQYTFGGSDDDLLTCSQLTPDGGFILAGYSESGVSGNKTDYCRGGYDYWLVKVDKNGVVEWQRTIGGGDHDYLFCLDQTSDGGYILGGTSISHISGEKTVDMIAVADYWIVKTDGVGNIEWQQTYGGLGFDYPYAIEQTI